LPHALFKLRCKIISILTDERGILTAKWPIIKDTQNEYNIHRRQINATQHSQMERAN